MSVDAALEAFAAALLDDDPHELYDRAPCGYLSTTPDGLIVKVNQTFLTLAGYERDELIGRRSFAGLLSGRRTDLSRNALRPAAANAGQRPRHRPRHRPLRR